MIDKKELRFGNLVALAHESKSSIAYVAQIKNRGIVWAVDDSYGYSSFDDLLPIELSPEWLERLGFEKRKDKINIWDFGRLTVWLENGCLCYLKEEDCQFSHYIPNGGVKYVHQLMNLAYFLTGEELIIKQ